MLKPSELTPTTSALLAAMLAKIFADDSGRRRHRRRESRRRLFRLPFDHLLFTGSTPVGRAVMRAASDNLVPVTLELGGKSPVIVERGSRSHSRARIAYGKLANARADLRRARLRARAARSEVETFVTAFAGGGGNSSIPIATIPTTPDHQRSPLHAPDRPGGRRPRKGARVDRARCEACQRTLDRAGAVPARRSLHRCHRRDDRNAGGDLRPDPADRAL